MILEPAIIKCPHCGLQSSHYMVMSGTIYSSDSYTDGKVDNITGAYASNPYLVRCRSCKGFYFFNEAASMDERNAGHEPVEELRHEEYFLQVIDYKDCTNSMIFNDIEKEKSVRILYWQAINDMIRFRNYYGVRWTWYFHVINIIMKPFRGWKRFHQNFRLYLSWNEEKKKNFESLLSLLNPDEDNSEDYLMVEIYREMGRFRDARRILKTIPLRGSRKFITFQRKLIFRRDRFVRKFPD